MNDFAKAVVYKNSWVSLENNQTQVYEHVSLRMNTATDTQNHRATDSESIQLTMSLPVFKVVGRVCKSCTTKSNY